MDAHAEKILRFEALRQAFALQNRPAPVRAALPTGCPFLDEATGGLYRAGLNELCGSSGSGALFLELLLHETHRRGSFLALVDASDTFDPTQYPPPLLRRLLWVRCGAVQEAVRAADLLIRDGNLPLILLDLQAALPAQLRHIPASTWHRYARLLEADGPTLLVFSRAPLVEGARLRLHCTAQWPLEAMETPRPQLAATLRPEVQERGEVPGVRRHSG